MKLASFNVENLFCRVRAMDQDSWQEGKDVLANYSRLNSILAKPVYSAADKKTALTLLEELGLSKSDESAFAILRQNRGRLLKRPKSGSAEIVAAGRGDWIGWLELKTEAVDETATQMTAKVIGDVNADVLAVIEAEDRVALKAFNEQLLRPLGAQYGGIMLIDGNDERGIDVGVLCKGSCSLGTIVSHVDEMQDGHPIFSRDCPEYTVQIGDGGRLLILVNHLKSKGYGSKAASDARRQAQAARVRQIYDARKAEGITDIAVVGDFNDTPDSSPLQPLLGNGCDLRDVTKHPNFQSDGRPGTYGNGTASNKIDYLLLSPSLFARVEAGGIFRKGVWGGTKGTLFPHYEEMTKPCQAASDHAAIWAELNL